MSLLSGYLGRKRQTITAAYVRGDVLDIGCQQGQLRELLASQLNRYVGIDRQVEDVLEAKQRYPDSEFRVLDIDDEPLGYDAEFDTIVLIAVIEHIFNLKYVGKNIARALKPGGSVVLTTPTPFGNDVIHRLGAGLGLFSPEAADDHIAIFNRKRIAIFAKEAGLVVSEHRRFQLFCNQIAILRRPDSASFQ
jgi:2-polyprenyl-3-methyl-5-hydroxy-6-metoxy-1,4-benzoquinol methylase